MDSSRPLRSFLLLLVVYFVASETSSSSKIMSSSAQEELLQHGFPIGLLPDTVVAFELKATDGHFEVQLESACHFVIPGDQYPVSYAPAVSGTLSQGHIRDLRGISVKAVFKWWTITAIRATDDQQLVFEVGPLTVNFPASNFYESPACEAAAASNAPCGLLQ